MTFGVAHYVINYNSRTLVERRCGAESGDGAFSWFWKGTDYGSAVNDTTPFRVHRKTPKKFLDGASMEYSITPALAYEGRYASFMSEFTLINDKKVYLRAGFKF